MNWGPATDRRGLLLRRALLIVVPLLVLTTIGCSAPIDTLDVEIGATSTCMSTPPAGAYMMVVLEPPAEDGDPCALCRSRECTILHQTCICAIDEPGLSFGEQAARSFEGMQVAPIEVEGRYCLEIVAYSEASVCGAPACPAAPPPSSGCARTSFDFGDSVAQLGLRCDEVGCP